MPDDSSDHFVALIFHTTMLATADFGFLRSSSTTSVARLFSPASLASRSAYRQRVSVAAVTAYLRLVFSSSAPRRRSTTTIILRRADQRPLGPVWSPSPAPRFLWTVI